MKTHHQFYINGEWVDPAEGVNSFDVINPSNEEVIAQIALRQFVLLPLSLIHI